MGAAARAKRPATFLAALLLAVAAKAQTATEFPPSAVPAGAAELKTHLDGKSFKAVYGGTTRVQLKFGIDGGISASAQGYYDTGTWRVEDGKLCGTLRKSGDFCNDARFDAGVLYLRRLNGEVVRYDTN